MNIRKATIEDLQIIQDFNNKLCAKENKEFDSTVNPKFATTEDGEKYFKNSLKDMSSLVLVAEDGDTPIGYIVGSIQKVNDFRNIPNMVEIDNMWVDEAYRSQGVGKRFMNKFEAWAKKNGVKRMRVIASYENKKGIDFYKKEGFGEYDLILEKDL